MTSVPSAKRRAAGHGDRRALVALAVPLLVIGLGFVGTTIYGELRASVIDRETAGIQTNALPSVEHLDAARSALRHLEVATGQYADETGAGRHEAELAIVAARKQIDFELAAEFSTPMYPGEEALAKATKHAMGAIDELLARLPDAVASSDGFGRYFVQREVRDAVERADGTLDGLVSLNAAEAHEEAARIAQNRSESMGIALTLDFVCVALSVGAAFVAFRSLRRQREIERAHEEMLEVRADELEMFANRVAHDLLSPLSALAFTLSAIRRNTERGISIAEPMDRAGACLKRSQRLVDGVLDFARSGASPAPAARADLREAIDGVLDEVRPDAAGMDLVVEPFEGAVELACAPGILASLISNLVRNAVKYMEGRPEKRVTIRVQPGSETVHLEVEDTGPGLPPGLEEHVFEPYVRAPDNARPGLGLGLATVRRFVESHHGQVGVRSHPDRGCIFWFDLPRPRAAEGAAVAERLTAAR